MSEFTNHNGILVHPEIYTYDYQGNTVDHVLPNHPDFPAAVEALKALVPEPEAEACHNCRFWTHQTENGKFIRGWCRRRSPVTGYDPCYMFPQTTPDEWCGEYERERG